MECKLKVLYERTLVAVELIDTLWNVNTKGMSEEDFAEWRINRYIMECKSSFFKVFRIARLELIDTLWNVNMYAGCSNMARS